MTGGRATHLPAPAYVAELDLQGRTTGGVSVSPKGDPILVTAAWADPRSRNPVWSWTGVQSEQLWDASLTDQGWVRVGEWDVSDGGARAVANVRPA